VTCSAFKRSTANEFITREVVTASLDERLHNLVQMGRAYVVLPGGTGTLLELAMMWELKNKGFLDRARPIILLGEFWKPLVELVSRDDPDCRKYVTFVQEPSQVVEVIESALRL
jgi:predicted Rossmann-fold nucleotide-binding protein